MLKIFSEYLFEKGKETMYEMKDEYLTGIEQIDAEHRRLFEIAEEIYQLQQQEFLVDKYDQIRTALAELREYTKFHFAHEEEYMESIQYKRMFMQKVQHDAFVKKLDEIDIQNLDEDEEGVISELLTFLTDWLVNHIMGTDKLIAEP